jgi:hypothetical protein
MIRQDDNCFGYTGHHQVINTRMNQPTKDLTEGGDLREEAQVDALGLHSHSCLGGIAGSVIDI